MVIICNQISTIDNPVLLMDKEVIYLLLIRDVLVLYLKNPLGHIYHSNNNVTKVYEIY